MEMYSLGLKNIASALLGNFHGAIGGLLKPPKAAAGLRTEEERRAENARQNYTARAMAACWSGVRYNR